MPPRRPNREPVKVRLDSDVIREVRILLLDPNAGQSQYSALSNLIDDLLLHWLRQQKVSPHGNTLPRNDGSTARVSTAGAGG